jgi:hypothetical protein
VKKYEKYGRNPSLIVKRFGKYRRKLFFFQIFHIISQLNLLFFCIFHIFSLFNLPFFHIVHILIVKRYGKCGRKLG